MGTAVVAVAVGLRKRQRETIIPEVVAVVTLITVITDIDEIKGGDFHRLDCIAQFCFRNCARKPRDSRVVLDRLTDELK